MIKVVFVCLGNICRSPMAEVVFKNLVLEQGLQDKISVDSAATSSWEKGNPVHKGTVQQLAKVGLSSEGIFSRQLNDTDLAADYLVAMDDNNLMDIEQFIAGRSAGEVKLLLDYAGQHRSIADPWYTGDFDTTYQDVYLGCRTLLDEIKNRLP